MVMHPTGVCRWSKPTDLSAYFIAFMCENAYTIDRQISESIQLSVAHSPPNLRKWALPANPALGLNPRAHVILLTYNFRSFPWFSIMENLRIWCWLSFRLLSQRRRQIAIAAEDTNGIESLWWGSAAEPPAGLQGTKRPVGLKRVSP